MFIIIIIMSHHSSKRLFSLWINSLEDFDDMFHTIIYSRSILSNDETVWWYGDLPVILKHPLQN